MHSPNPAIGPCIGIGRQVCYMSRPLANRLVRSTELTLWPIEFRLAPPNNRRGTPPAQLRRSLATTQGHMNWQAARAPALPITTDQLTYLPPLLERFQFGQPTQQPSSVARLRNRMAC